MARLIVTPVGRYDDDAKWLNWHLAVLDPIYDSNLTNEELEQDPAPWINFRVTIH
jgi:hypothetical protein